MTARASSSQGHGMSRIVTDMIAASHGCDRVRSNREGHGNTEGRGRGRSDNHGSTLSVTAAVACVVLRTPPQHMLAPRPLRSASSTATAHPPWLCPRRRHRGHPCRAFPLLVPRSLPCHLASHTTRSMWPPCRLVCVSRTVP